MLNEALMSSAKPDWETPESFLELVRKLGPIVLDPCTTDDNPVRAWRFYTPRYNGLEQDWVETVGMAFSLCVQPPHPLIYMNPPYGREIEPWMRKWVTTPRHFQSVALVPARTDTRWFQDAVEHVDAACFLRGRLKFRGARHSAPFPSAVLYRGMDSKRFADVFAAEGAVWI